MTVRADRRRRPPPAAVERLRGVHRAVEERLNVAVRHGAVQRIGRRHDADQDQHDQAHALLAVVRAVREADAGAGEDQQARIQNGGGAAPFGSL